MWDNYFYHLIAIPVNRIAAPSFFFKYSGNSGSNMTNLFVSLLTVISRVQFNGRLDIDACSILFVGGDDGEIADDNDDAGSDQDFAG